jgi:hypothetical protein
MSSSQDAASPPEAADEHHDDDALSWGDERDATYVDAPDNVVSAPKQRREHDPDAPVGSGSLVGMGVIGAVYLLYTVAWLITASTQYVSGTDTVLTVAVDVMRILAVVAPAAWFTTALWVGGAARARTRFTWLLLGLVVLVPWPFVMTRSFG